MGQHSSPDQRSVHGVAGQEQSGLEGGIVPVGGLTGQESNLGSGI
jgi:hypothetical protein